MTLKLAQVSDVHLGAKFVYLGAKADDHRNNLKKAFRAAVQESVKNKADIFIIAGDLFDNSFPSKTLQLFALENIKELNKNGIHVFLISGNHDRTEKGGVYDSSMITEYKDRKFILVNREVQQEFKIEELGLRVIATGTEHQKNKKPPYTLLKADPNYAFNIGIFHGSADIKGAPENNPIYLADLKASKFNYFALGDWHNMLQPDKNVEAWYSGSPEIVDSDQEKAGNMLFVTLEGGKKPNVEPFKIGTKIIENLEVDVEKYKNIQEIVAEIKKKSSKDLILNLTLKGLKSVEFVVDKNELWAMIADDFYYINIKDSTKLKLSAKDLQSYPENMLIGKYIKLLMDQKKNDDQEWNNIVDEAIQLGVSMLKGGAL